MKELKSLIEDDDIKTFKVEVRTKRTEMNYFAEKMDKIENKFNNKLDEASSTTEPTKTRQIMRAKKHKHKFNIYNKKYKNILFEYIVLSYCLSEKECLDARKDSELQKIDVSELDKIRADIIEKLKIRMDVKEFKNQIDREIGEDLKLEEYNENILDLDVLKKDNTTAIKCSQCNPDVGNYEIWRMNVIKETIGNELFNELIASQSHL